jgi:hypothetical protein
VIDDDLKDEVAAIEAALRAHGSMDRDALKREVNSRRWGPGCFARALSQAVEAGIVTRVGRNRYALSGDGRPGGVSSVQDSQREPAGRR